MTDTGQEDLGPTVNEPQSHYTFEFTRQHEAVKYLLCELRCQAEWVHFFRLQDSFGRSTAVKWAGGKSMSGGVEEGEKATCRFSVGRSPGRWSYI
jgi:hypothetical protein